MPPEADALVQKVLHSGRLAEGEWSRRFEEGLAGYLGHPHVVAVSDIHNALGIALQLAGVGPGDHVVSSPVACLATNMPILAAHAKVVWADVDPSSGLMTDRTVAEALTPRTKAVIAYHWGGDVADVDAIGRVAKEAGATLIEDAQEAFGAALRGRPIGHQTADATAFSFYANRHITTGEGGALALRTPELAAAARLRKRYGIDQTRFRDALGEIDPACDIAMPGPSAYLPNLAGAIGVAQLAHHERLARARRENAAYFDKALAGIDGIRVVDRTPGSTTASWVYTLLAERRDDLLRALRDRGIRASKMHHRNDLYSAFGPPGRALPGVTSFAERALCIPSGWWVGPPERARIVAALEEGW